MTDAKESMIAYLATLLAIVLLALFAAAVCIFADFRDEGTLAKVIGALAFVGSAETGLIGVIGTFRPKGPPVASTTSGDVNLGQGEGDA